MYFKFITLDFESISKKLYVLVNGNNIIAINQTMKEALNIKHSS